MNILEKYITYLKDNPEGYWFKRKLYGWGWTPARPQGWLTLGLFIVLVFINFYRLDAVSHSASDTLIPFLIQTGLMTIVFILICYKTGESPKWQWGLKDEEDKIL